MKSNVTIMPIKTFLEERIRQQESRRTVIKNYLRDTIMVGNKPHYSSDDLTIIENDISDCSKCLNALLAA